jgi:anti-sigma factor RsiW
MRHELEVELLRLASGELPADRERALRDRLARDPELAAAYRRLESAWRGLELPPPAPVPLGFSGRVMSRVRALDAAGAPAASASVSWAAAPNWVRATAAAALVAGVLLGAGLGTRRAPDEGHGTAGVPALTESYWAMVETAGEPAPGPALPSSPRGEARR